VGKDIGTPCTDNGGHFCRNDVCTKYIPVVCGAGGKYYSACDGVMHDYSVSYFVGTGTDLMIEHCYATYTDPGFCPTGSPCNVLLKNGTLLSGTCTML